MEYITVTEVRNIIQKEIFQMEVIEQSLIDAQYHYSAEPVYAPIDVPSFDNSAMDGYAFAYQDYEDKKELRVCYTIQAGDTELPVLKSGEVARIFTGAMIPQGADTVVMQEKVKKENAIIFIEEHSFSKGQNIRLKGSQSQKGDLLIPENTLITSGVIGMLAGFGIDHIKVFSYPKVGIIVTGNELAEAGKPLKTGQIYESNSLALQSVLKDLHIQSLQTIKVSDKKKSTSEAIKTMMEKVDVLLITGGISVGDYDFVKESLQELEVNQLFYKIQQKPGKPLFFGKKENRFVFALPGNPASVLTCFYQYVKPFLEGLKGRTDFFQDKSTACLSSDFDKKNDLTNFLKGRAENGEVTILSSQESYKMDSFAQANCLVEISGEKRKISQGEKIALWKI